VSNDSVPRWLYDEVCDRVRELLVQQSNSLTEINKLRGVLRMVKADRPTAHSDKVWFAINEALEST
jgi:hypothetical protein